jgi:hypothetical protein
MTTYPHYRQITKTGAIIRLIGRNPDGTLIADILHGQEEGRGWWRLVPLPFKKFVQDTTKLTEFTDHYPQAFLPHH